MTKKFLALLLALLMLLSVFPTAALAEETATTTKVYKLVSSVTADKQYIISNVNTGEGYALANSSKSVSKVEITVENGDIDNDKVADTYIATNDTSVIMTAASATDGIKFTNNGSSLYYDSGLRFSGSSSSAWSYTNNQMKTGKRYLYYSTSSNKFNASSDHSSDKIYVYEFIGTIEVPETVEITPTTDNPSKDVEIAVGETLTLKVKNGSHDGTYTFTASSNKISVATVTESVTVAPGATGELTISGITDGKAIVSITNNNQRGDKYSRKATINVTVGTGINPETPVETETVEITPTTDNPSENVKIAVGETLKIKVKNGSSQNETYTFAASSNKISVATVTESVTVAPGATGELTISGIADGKAIISITNNNTHGDQYSRKATINVTVGTGKEPVIPSSETIYLAFNSDVHNDSDNSSAERLNEWINTVTGKLGSKLTDFGFCGDLGPASGTFWPYAEKVIKTVEDSVNVINNGFYVCGNHEWSPGNFSGSSDKDIKNKYTVNGGYIEKDNYVLYSFGALSFSYDHKNIDALDNYLENAPTDRPIFILSHFPLHDYGGHAVNYEDDVISILNKHADTHTIIFLWGHNHTEGDYHYNKIYTDKIVDNNGKTEKVIKFTYASAGCLADDGYGSSGQVNDIGLVATIGEESVLLTYYKLDGSTGNSHFIQLNKLDPDATYYTVTASAEGNGTISPSGNIKVKEGTSKEFTFTPESPKYKVGTVLVSGSDVTENVTDNKYTIENVTADQTIKVTFVEDESYTGPDVELTPTTDNPTVSKTIKVGEKLTVRLINGSENKDYDFKVSSSKPDVAKADKDSVEIEMNGGTGDFVITGLTSGTTIIKFTNNNKQYGQDYSRVATINLTVVGNGETDPVVPDGDKADVVLTPTTDNPTESKTIKVGEKLTVRLTNGSTREDYDFEVSSSNPEVAEADTKTINIKKNNGTGDFVITGLTSGTTIIKFTNNNKQGGTDYSRVATINLTVVGNGETDPVVPDDDKIEDGKYIIVVDGQALTANTGTDYTNGGTYHYTGLDGKDYTDGVTPVTEDMVWEIKASGDGYTIKNGDNFLNGVYVLGDNSAESTLKVDGTSDIWTYSDGILTDKNAGKQLEYGNNGGTAATIFAMRSNGSQITLYKYEEEPEEEPATYTVEVETEGSGTANADKATAKAGDTVTLTASPTNIYVAFKEWQVVSGDVTIIDNKFTMPEENVKIKAVFADLHNIIVQNDGNGIATANATSAISGTDITLTAFPNNGYIFKEWQVESGDVTITDNKFTMPNAVVRVKAIFKEVPPDENGIILEVQGHGTVSASNLSAREGTIITIKAIPDEGYAFKEWVDVRGNAGEFDKGKAETTFTMPDKEAKIKAVFEKIIPNENAIIVEVQGHGVASASDLTAESGDIIVLNAEADEGYAFKEWIDVRGNAGKFDKKDKNTYFTMPNAEVKVKAVFERVYNINLQSDEHATPVAFVNNEEATTARAGDTVELHYKDMDEGYQFNAFEIVSGEVVFDEIGNSFIMPEGNVTIRMTFKKAENDPEPEEPEEPEKKPANVVVIEIGRQAEENGEENPETGATVINLSTGISVIAGIGFLLLKKKH